jgi:uncharacterized protein YbjT (DUF2867 family)
MPEPILVSIAAALAAKTVQSVYELVKKKFADRKEAKAALEAAEGKPADSPEVLALAGHLERTEAEDPQFAAGLRQLWNSQTVNQSGVGTTINNSMSGTSSGPVIQIGQVHGGMTGLPGA